MLGWRIELRSERCYEQNSKLRPLSAQGSTNRIARRTGLRAKVAGVCTRVECGRRQDVTADNYSIWRSALRKICGLALSRQTSPRLVPFRLASVVAVLTRSMCKMLGKRALQELAPGTSVESAQPSSTWNSLTGLSRHWSGGESDHVPKQPRTVMFHSAWRFAVDLPRMASVLAARTIGS